MICSAHVTRQSSTEVYQHRQQKAGACGSLITALAVGTLAMVGVVLAAHFGAFAVSHAAAIGIYTATGVVGLGCIASIFSRCINRAEKPVVYGDFILNEGESLKAVNSKISREVEVQIVRIGENQLFLAIFSNEVFNYSPIIQNPAEDLAQKLKKEEMVVCAVNQRLVLLCGGEEAVELNKNNFSSVVDIEKLFLTVDLIDKGLVVVCSKAANRAQELAVLFARERFPVLFRDDQGQYQLCVRKSDGSTKNLFIAASMEEAQTPLKVSDRSLFFAADGMVRCFAIESSKVQSFELSVDAIYNIGNDPNNFISQPADIFAGYTENNDHTVTISTKNGKHVRKPFIEGDSSQFTYSQNTYSILKSNNKFYIVYANDWREDGASVYEISTDPHLAYLFSEQQITYKEPKLIELKRSELVPDKTTERCQVYKIFCKGFKDPQVVISASIGNPAQVILPEGNWGLVVDLNGKLWMVIGGQQPECSELESSEYFAYIFTNQKNRIDQITFQAAPAAAAIPHIVEVDENPTSETAQAFLQKHGDRAIAHNPKSQEVTLFFLKDKERCLQTYRYTTVSQRNENMGLKKSEHVITMHNHVLYHVYKNTKGQVVQKLENSKNLSWLCEDYAEHKYVKITAL